MYGDAWRWLGRGLRICENDEFRLMRRSKGERAEFLYTDCLLGYKGLAVSSFGQHVIVVAYVGLYAARGSIKNDCGRRVGPPSMSKVGIVGDHHGGGRGKGVISRPPNTSVLELSRVVRNGREISERVM